MATYQAIDTLEPKGSSKTTGKVHEDDKLIEEDKGDARREYLSSCCESNIYSRIAVTHQGQLFKGCLILFLQVFIPYRIILDNFQNVQQCQAFGDLLMPWDTVIVSSCLIYLLWLTILNDTTQSMRGFEYILSITHIPRRYAAVAGMLITPVTNLLTGMAASVVLLSSETTIVDVAKDSMALFFISRLDEDFGGLHSMVGVVKRRFGLMDDEDEIDEENFTEFALNKFGPYDSTIVRTDSFIEYVILLLEYVFIIASFIVPFIYFACAI